MMLGVMDILDKEFLDDVLLLYCMEEHCEVEKISYLKQVSCLAQLMGRF